LFFCLDTKEPKSQGWSGFLTKKELAPLKRFKLTSAIASVQTQNVF